jgi:hypothetical protein
VRQQWYQQNSIPETALHAFALCLGLWWRDHLVTKSPKWS